MARAIELARKERKERKAHDVLNTRSAGGIVGGNGRASTAVTQSELSETDSGGSIMPAHKKELRSQPLRPLIEKYLAWKIERDASESNLQGTRWWLGLEVEGFGLLSRFTDVAELDDDKALEAWFNGLRKKDGAAFSSASKVQAWATLRAFTRWATKKRLIHRNPTDSMDAPTLHRKPALLPTAEEVKAMLDAAGNSSRGRKQQAELMLLLDGGFRVGELMSLRWADWNGNGQFRVREGKTDTSTRTVPITGVAAQEAFHRYVRTVPQEQRQSERYIFATDERNGRDGKRVGGGRTSEAHMLHVVYGLWARACKAHPEFDPTRRPKVHTFRKLAITNWKRAGVPIEDAAKMAGHANTKTTATIYYAPDPADLENISRKAGASDKFLNGGK